LHHNDQARLEVFGQEPNAETYAICRSDMMLKGEDATNIVYGNSFSEDGHQSAKFDYLLANPPFGVEWKKVKDTVQVEHETQGFAGRFGAGLPGAHCLLHAVLGHSWLEHENVFVRVQGLWVGSMFWLSRKRFVES